MPSQIRISLLPGGTYETYIYIVDADGENSEFHWQLASNRTWIIPQEVKGVGATSVRVLITSENPSQTEGAITVYSDMGQISRTVTFIRTVVSSAEEFSFLLIPSYVSLVERHTPGTDPEDYSFKAGILCENPSGNISCVASTTSGWLKLEDNENLGCGSSFSVTVSPKGLWEANHQGSVLVVCNGLVQEIPVTLTIEEQINDQLIVSPETLEINIAKAELLPRTFTIRIKNANPEGRSFSFRAQSEASWLRIEPQSGVASSKEGALVSLVVDPAGLPAGDYESVVRFFSDLDENSATEGVALTVALHLLPWHTLEIFPGGLFWSLEKSEDGSLVGAYSQRIHVYAGGEGWSISTNVPWLRLTSLWPGTGEAPEGYFEVELVTEALQGLPCGRYRGEIRVTGRKDSLFRSIPVTVEIRRPTDPVLLPVEPPTWEQIVPEFARVQAVETSLLSFRFPAAAPPQTPEECEGLLGHWKEGHCVFNDRVYLLLESPQLWPGQVFAWRPTEGRFVECERGGVPLAGADDLYVTLGPVGEISFGPVQPLGLSGEVFLEVRVGPNYREAKTLKRIEVQIYTPQGAWQITDYFEGQAYLHPDVLVFRRAGGLWSACWELEGQCVYPVAVTPGDGDRFFYRLEFGVQGFWFEYEVQKLSPTEIGGRWRFFDGKKWSDWEKFEGKRAGLWPE